MGQNFQPYPWDRLPRLSHADLRLLSSLTVGLAGLDRTTVRELGVSLLGASIGVTDIHIANAQRRDPLSAFVELTGDVSVICEVPGTLAAWIVNRALGGDAQLRSVDAGLGVRDEADRGVLAYVMTRVLQLLSASVFVASVDVDSPLLRERLERSNARCIRLTLTADSVSTPVHLWVLAPITTHRIATRATNSPLAAQLLLDHAVLSAQLVATVGISSHTAYALSIDDVIVLPTPGLQATDNGYRGTVKVAVLGARRHHWLASACGDRLELQQRHTTGEDRMTAGKIDTDGTSTTETLTAVADAPIELSVEIARFTLPLGEIATLHDGDVLLTGRPIGEYITLRAGTRAIATGELVNVDGAVGVRIVTLANT